VKISNIFFGLLSNSQGIENLLQKLNSVYEATEGTDGWITVGNIK